MINIKVWASGKQQQLARTGLQLTFHPAARPLQAKTHEKVDSIGEERSIGCHAVIMLIRKDLA